MDGIYPSIEEDSTLNCPPPRFITSKLLGIGKVFFSKSAKIREGTL